MLSECGLAEIDMVIILDASTSVTASNFKKMLDFCKNIIRNADIDAGYVRVGVLIYSTEVSFWTIYRFLRCLVVCADALHLSQKQFSHARVCQQMQV